MAPSIVAVLAIGGLLGLRHAFEPDHLAAVSTLATRPGGKRLWSAAGAIAALLVAAVPDTTSRLVYFAAFSAGTIVGMLGVSLTLSVLVRFAADRGARWGTFLHVGAAVGSVVAGVVLAQQVIFTP